MKTNKTLRDFISLFSTTADVSIKETFKELSAVFKTNDIISVPSNADILSIINFVNARDSLKVTVLIGEDEPIDYYSSQDYTPFFEELNNRLEIREDEDIEVMLTLTKNNINGILSVYLPEKLFTHLLNIDLKGILYSIANAFTGSNYLLLESQYEAIDFKTNSIWLSNDISAFTPSSLIPKKERINSSKGLCNFNLVNQYNFIPDDFFVEVSSNQQIKVLFSRLCVIYSIAFLYDITTIETSSIEYKLNGYKSIKGTVNFTDVRSEQAKEYFEIYKWCYTGGNLSDKIGLARNIISLHLEKPDQIDIKGNAYQSIQSSYKVYEKQNIKQYIEIRNKISDQLLAFNDRANKIIETFASGFQKSALALISFYISAIVLKLLGKAEMVNVFTLDSTILSIVFISCSYIYFRVSLWEVKEQKKRFISSYNNLKERYLDLLDSVDIERILNNDKEFKADILFIDEKKKMYGRMWKGYLIILLSTTIILFTFYNITYLLDTRLMKFLFSKCPE